MESQSVVSKSLSVTVKARRAFQIKKLQKEFDKLQARLEQATDLNYRTELKAKLHEMETSKKSNTEKIAKMEIE